MNKSIKLLLVAASALLILGTSCGKYEDGPKFSLRSKKARMANTWELTEYFDGDDNITENTAGKTIEMTKDGNFTEGGSNSNTGAFTVLTGIWEFGPNKTDVRFTHDGQPTADKWIITRLKNKELWLKKDQANGRTATKKFKGLD